MTTEKKPTVLLIDAYKNASLAVATASHHDCQAIVLEASSAEVLLQQFEEVDETATIQAVNIGFIPNAEVVGAIRRIVGQLPNVPVVYAPTFVSLPEGEGSTVESRLLEAIKIDLLPMTEVLVLEPSTLNTLAGESESLALQVNRLLKAGVRHCLVSGGYTDSQCSADYFANAETSFYCYYDVEHKRNTQLSQSVLMSSIASHLANGQDVRDAVILANAYSHRGLRLAHSDSLEGAFEHSAEPLAIQDIPKLCYAAEYIGRRFEFASGPSALGIYPVVDSADWVTKLVDCGVPTIQLRVKDKPQAALSAEIKQAVDYLANKPVSFFVNDYWPLAIEHKAYGVHLGQEDLHDAQLEAIADAGLRLGVSTHSYWELARALAVNPSYIALGPIYATTSKPMPFSPQGEARLQQWVHLLADHYPLVAIGGIDLPRAKQLKKTGVGSVAMITAITKADDYRKVAKEFLAAWDI